MVKSNQIYPLIHDLKPLQQKQEVNAPRGNALIDDYINEREERPKYNMLDEVGIKHQEEMITELK